MEVRINRVPLMVLAKTMQKLVDTHPFDMAWYNGKVISPTLPSNFLKYG